MKKFFITVLTSIVAFSFLVGIQNSKKSNVLINEEGQSIRLSMPLVTDDPLATNYGATPKEERGIDVRKWLSPSVKINVAGASGSGTIVYFDPTTKYAYVQSCGHLWDGAMSAKEGKSRKLTCKVVLWYKNNEKLPKSQIYPAEVLYYYNASGHDISLLRFKPDFEPNYFSIAPVDYQIKEGTILHSVGCDGGEEVAHYSVEVVYYRKVDGTYYQDLVTIRNSPRPGRSGGGLMSNEYYVGICWGTSAYDGGGNGYFTPLPTIREFNEREGYGWLNDVGNMARQLPIIDRNSPQKNYPKDYIPMPNAVIYYKE